MNANMLIFRICFIAHASAAAHLLLLLKCRKLCTLTSFANTHHITNSNICFEFFAYSCEGHGSLIARHLIRFLPLTVLSNGMSHDFSCLQSSVSAILLFAIVLLNVYERL